MRVWQKRPLLLWPRLVKDFGCKVKKLVRKVLSETVLDEPGSYRPEKGRHSSQKASGLTGKGRACCLRRVGVTPGRCHHPLSPLSGQIGQWAQGLSLPAGRPPLPGQPSRHRLPGFSGATLVSVLQPAWSLLSGRAGAPPAPATSPTGCDSWQL